MNLQKEGKMEKKRLKKDLPFGNLKAGEVLTKCNKEFRILCGETWYSPNLSGSDRGIITFEKAEEEILLKIWNDEEWFEDASLDVLKIKVSTSKIEFQFKPLDLEDAQTLAKGIVFCLNKHFGEEKSYVWNKFRFRIES